MVAEGPMMEAEQVLARMVEAYKACKTYQDNGEVQTLFDSKRGQRTTSLAFRTAFVRPDKLRFEFTERPAPGDVDKSYRFVMWADGRAIRSWWTLKPEIKQFDSIDMALAGPTGISGGAAVLLTPMLVKVEIRDRPQDLRQPGLGAEEQADGAPCYRVDGKDEDAEPKTVWVDKATFLIRKVVQHNTFKDFTTVRTTTLKPKVDEPIPDKVFTFDPGPETKEKKSAHS